MNAASRAPFSRRLLPSFDGTSAAEIVLALLIVLTPLAIGGVHFPTQLVVAVAAVAAFALASAQLRRQRRRVYVGWFGLAWGLALAWMLFQWIPLPAGLADLISPASGEARRLAAQALGTDAPGLYPVSVDHGMTAAAIVALIGLGAAFMTGLNLRTDSGVTKRVLLYVEIAALLVLAVGVVQRLLEVDAIYGVYAASIDLRSHALITPFVNPNHAAALMLAGALIAFGSWLDATKDSRWHLFCGVALTIGVLTTMSRANALLLVPGLLALGAYAWRLRRDDGAAAVRFPRLLVGVSCVAFATIVVVGPEGWLSELSTLTRDVGEDGLIGGAWRVGWQVASAQPWVGVGAGTFALVAPSVMESWSTGLFSYAHNGVFQIVAELGFVVGGAVLLLAGVGLVNLLYRARVGLQAAGVAVAVAAVCLQNGVDFSLWLHGVSIPLAAALGVAVASTWRRPTHVDGGRSAHTRPHERPTRGRGRLAWSWPWPATAALAGTLIVAGLHAWHEQPSRWRAEIATQLDAGKPGAIPLDDLLLAHPHDYYGFRLGATVAARASDDGRRLELLERAHALAPSDPDTLEALAGAQLRAGDDRGLATTIEALADLGRDGGRRAVRVVLAAPRPVDELATFFGGRPELVLRGADHLARRGDLDEAQALVLWGIERHPDAVALVERLAGWWHGRPDRKRALERLSSDLLGRAGATDDPAERATYGRVGYLLSGHVLRLERRELAAWHMYIEAAELSPDAAVAPLVAAGRAAVALERPELVDDVLARLDQHDVRGAWPSARYRWLRSLQAEWRGDVRLAIREMQHATRHVPRHIAFHTRLAQLYRRAGDPLSADRAGARAEALRNQR